MKVGTITKTNQKGQIVIPKRFRKLLGINPDDLLNLVIRGRGIYIYPITEIITSTEGESSYLKILEKTKGKCSENWGKLREKRRAIELSASKKRKKRW